MARKATPKPVVISDEQLQRMGSQELHDLLVRLVAECRGRGELRATTQDIYRAALEFSALEVEERERIALAASQKEAERLRAEEAHRIAQEATDRVRRDAEKAKAQEAEDKARKQADQLRAFARRARELMGNDVVDFTVQAWEKNGDRRIYIGKGFDGNWVEYHHTGSARMAPETLKFHCKIDATLAQHLGCTVEEARNQIKTFCQDFARAWKVYRLDVTENNAPRDPAALQVRWVLRLATSVQDRFLGDFGVDREPRLNGNKNQAIKYTTREEAESIARELKTDTSSYEAVEYRYWLIFPAK